MKKGLLLTFLASLLVVVPATVSMAKVYKIGVTQIISHPAIDACRKGFYDQMAEEGFVKDKNVKYDFRNAEGDMSLVASIAKKFVAEKVDLIYSISTPSTQACVAATEGTDIPVIFGAMTDPVAAKVVSSWDKPGGNCTGASDWAEAEPQIKLIKEILPEVKVIGTVYNAGEMNSVVQVKEFKKAAAKFGVEKVIEATAATTADVYAAVNSLAGRVDCIWIGTDSTAVSSIGSIIKVCEEKKIMLYSTDKNQVEKGAVVSIGLSYYVLGKESGKMVAKVLKGAKPADMPVVKAPLTDLFINTAAAKRMGVTIPQAVLDRATKTFTK
ncbi:MAG: ABC transporter substrate-binding protein [Deltaproteobacteria bacterium]|nr:ABC transporter substrate-binding protein [Deltaproteobacteria bacterium]